ncbi:TetR/AcrR family transcriptional regulator [Croceibacterium ferulae]|uniref:TetR/AcrR family transcriptional regulator n=1 Tax=Croceibacterium ferulae TaxID=1854641 RepID=UPI000EB5D560|nr:TetR family transcriptional regulator [Croceibacterium ferulae]
MSIRTRLSSEQSRAQALQAAHDLLLADGPAAVTLKAVAGRIGRTHANLLHHFGSAAGLQQALVQHLTAQVSASIAASVLGGVATPRAIVDLVFDAFDTGGGGALAQWMLATNQHGALDPFAAAIGQVVDGLFGQGGTAPARLHQTALALVLLALGDALLGQRLAGAMALPPSAARAEAETLVAAALAQS